MKKRLLKSYIVANPNWFLDHDILDKFEFYSLLRIAVNLKAGIIYKI